MDKGLANFIIQPIIHPIDGTERDIQELEHIADVVDHPVELGSAIWNSVSTSWENDIVNGDAESRSRWVGDLAGNIAIGWAGGEVADAVTVASKAAEATGVASQVATVASDSAPILSDTATVTSEAADAFQAAKTVDTPFDPYASYGELGNMEGDIYQAAADSRPAVDEGLGNSVEDTEKAKPYSNSRPSYGKGQVGEVWENAKDIDGKVYDPNTGEELNWDKSKSRAGQWDMGHTQENKYSDIHEKYLNGEITKDEFLEWYRNPNNYRPESPSANRSHKYE